MLASGCAAIGDPVTGEDASPGVGSGKADGVAAQPSVLRLSRAHDNDDGSVTRTMVLPSGRPLVARYREQIPRFTLRSGPASVTSNWIPAPIPKDEDVAIRTAEPDRMIGAITLERRIFLGTMELGVDETMNRTQVGTGEGLAHLAVGDDTSYVAWAKRTYQPGPDRWTIEIATCPMDQDCDVQTAATFPNMPWLLDFVVHEDEPILAFAETAQTQRVLRLRGGSWSELGSVDAGRGYRAEILLSAPGRLVMLSADTAYELQDDAWVSFATLPTLQSQRYTDWAPDAYQAALTAHGLTIVARKKMTVLWRESEDFVPRDVSDSDGILGPDGRAWSLGYPYNLSTPPAPSDGEPMHFYDTATRGLPIDSPIPCVAGRTLTGTVNIGPDEDPIAPGTCIHGATIHVAEGAEGQLLGEPDAPIMLLDSDVLGFKGRIRLAHVWAQDTDVNVRSLAATESVFSRSRLTVHGESLELGDTAILGESFGVRVYPEPGSEITVHNVEILAGSALNSHAPSIAADTPPEVAATPIVVDINTLDFRAIEQSEASPTVEDGALVLHQAEGSIVHTSIVGGPSHGIVLRNSDVIEIRDSLVADNAGHGITVDAEIPRDLSECVPRSHHGREDPNWVRNLYRPSADPIVSGSTIRDNGGSGIEVNYPFITMWVYENRIERNGGEGFAIRRGRGHSGGPCGIPEDGPYCCYVPGTVDLPLAQDTEVTDNVFAHNGSLAGDRDVFSAHLLGVLRLTDNCWTQAVERSVSCTGTCDTTVTRPPC